MFVLFSSFWWLINGDEDDAYKSENIWSVTVQHIQMPCLFVCTHIHTSSIRERDRVLHKKQAFLPVGFIFIVSIIKRRKYTKTLSAQQHREERAVKRIKKHLRIYMYVCVGGFTCNTNKSSIAPMAVITTEFTVFVLLHTQA